MTDIIFEGKIVVKDNCLDTFLKELDDLLKRHKATYVGNIRSCHFEDCEVIEFIPND